MLSHISASRPCAACKDGLRCGISGGRAQCQPLAPRRQSPCPRRPLALCLNCGGTATATVHQPASLPSSPRLSSPQAQPLAAAARPAPTFEELSAAARPAPTFEELYTLGESEGLAGRDTAGTA